MAKHNRADLLRSSMAVEKAVQKDRFAAADVVMDKRPGGLAQVSSNADEITPVQPSFSAESTAPLLSAPSLHHYADLKVDSKDRVLDILISKVHDNPYNARRVYRPEKIKERAASIAADGQKTPVNAMEHPEIPGDFILLDGHYRKKALIHLGRETIRLIVDPAKEKFEMYRISRLLNVQRDDQTALDDALVWSQMKEEGIFKSDEDISEKVGVSLATVSKTLALLKLPSVVLEKLKEAPNKFGVAMGYEIFLCSKVMSEDLLLNLVNDVIEKDTPTRDVQAMRERLAINKPRKQKEVNRIYKLRSGEGEQIGSFKVGEAGKVAFEVQLADPKERASLIDELKRRFGIEDDGG